MNRSPARMPSLRLERDPAEPDPATVCQCLPWCWRIAMGVGLSDDDGEGERGSEVSCRAHVEAASRPSNLAKVLPPDGESTVRVGVKCCEACPRPPWLAGLLNAERQARTPTRGTRCEGKNTLRIAHLGWRVFQAARARRAQNANANAKRKTDAENHGRSEGTEARCANDARALNRGGAPYRFSVYRELGRRS